MTEDKKKDRRRFRRIPVEMCVEESQEEALYFQRSANLSQGGMFLEQTIPHPLDTLVKLEFSLPNHQETIVLQARIVNTPTGEDQLGMGLAFIDLDEETANLIAEYIDSRK